MTLSLAMIVHLVTVYTQDGFESALALLAVVLLLPPLVLAWNTHHAKREMKRLVAQNLDAVGAAAAAASLRNAGLDAALVAGAAGRSSRAAYKYVLRARAGGHRAGSRISWRRTRPPGPP